MRRWRVVYQVGSSAGVMFVDALNAEEAARLAVAEDPSRVIVRVTVDTRDPQ